MKIRGYGVVRNVMLRGQLTYEIVRYGNLFNYTVYIKRNSKKKIEYMDPYLLTVSPTKPYIRYRFFTHVLSIHAGLVICPWGKKNKK